jgi:hypothetical protein
MNFEFDIFLTVIPDSLFSNSPSSLRSIPLASWLLGGVSAPSHDQRAMG